MMVKVCGMRDAQNIAAIARLTPAPDMMGFIFHAPSPRNVCSMLPEALKALPSGIKRVGVFVDAPIERILETAYRYGLDLVQLHGEETPEICAELRGLGLGVIKAFGVALREDVDRTAEYENTCDLYIFDTRTTNHGGSGVKFDHALLENYRGTTPYLLSGGLGPDDAEHLAAARYPFCVGFDINSCFETLPGVKEPAAIEKFIKTIKTQTP